MRSIRVDQGEDTLAAHVMHGLAAENQNKHWQRISLCVVVRGVGTFESEHGTHFDLAPGTCFIHPPNRWHHIRRQRHRRWIEVSVGFGERFTPHLTALGLIDAQQPVGFIGDLDRWLAQFAQYRRMLSDPHVADSRCLVAAFALVVAASASAPPLAEDAAISRSRVDLSNDVHERIDLADLARSLGMSYAHFRRRFTSIVGCGPAAWRRRHRLDHAALLLRQHGFSVAEAAQAIGYATPFAFSRIFSATFGISPSAYAAGGTPTAPPGQSPASS